MDTPHLMLAVGLVLAALGLVGFSVVDASGLRALTNASLHWGVLLVLLAGVWLLVRDNPSNPIALAAAIWFGIGVVVDVCVYLRG